MLKFTFRINRSFLQYRSHPITVPRSQVSYDEVERLLRHSNGAWISIHGSRPLRALLYRGTAGFGPYYQIRSVEAVQLRGAPMAIGTLTLVSIDVANSRLLIDVALVESDSTSLS
jgi:hypothetical protein